MNFENVDHDYSIIMFFVDFVDKDLVDYIVPITTYANKNVVEIDLDSNYEKIVDVATLEHEKEIVISLVM